MAAKKNAEANAPSVEETKEQEAKVEAEAASEAERQPTKFYRVSVNPKLQFTSQVSVNDFTVYADADENRTRGTEYMDDVQWESISGANRDPDSGLAYIVRKKIGETEGNEEEVN